MYNIIFMQHLQEISILAYYLAIYKRYGADDYVHYCFKLAATYPNPFDCAYIFTKAIELFSEVY